MYVMCYVHVCMVMCSFFLLKKIGGFGMADVFVLYWFFEGYVIIVMCYVCTCRLYVHVHVQYIQYIHV